MLLIVWRQFSTCSGWHSTPNLSLIAWAARANDPGINVLDGLFPLVASLASISIIKHCICFDHLNCSLILSSSSFVLPIATVARTRRVIKIEHKNTKNYMWKLYLLSTRKFYYQNETSNVRYEINKEGQNITVFNKESSRKSHYIANYTEIYHMAWHISSISLTSLYFAKSLVAQQVDTSWCAYDI